MPDLLIELFSEEIPARMQARAREDLRKLVTDGLVEAGLTYASAGAFSTPRRLVLSVEGLTSESRPVREERKGPSVSAPAQAVEGFLRSKQHAGNRRGSDNRGGVGQVKERDPLLPGDFTQRRAPNGEPNSLARLVAKFSARTGYATVSRGLVGHAGHGGVDQ